MYYNYHNKLKQLLKTEQYICIEEQDNKIYKLFSVYNR